MRIEIGRVPAQWALEISDLVADDPNVRSFQRETADGPAGIGVTEVYFVFTVVIAAGTASRFIAETVYKIRQRFRPFQVVDFTGEEPKLHVIEDAPGMRGEVVLRSRDGEELRMAEQSDIPALVEAIARALKP